MCLAVKWLAGRAKGQVRRGRTRTLLYVLLMACLLAQGAFGYFWSRGHRLVQREVGLWMKDNLPRSARVMGWVPQETFYAELEWVWMSEQTYEKVLEKARSKGVEYLLLHEDTEEIPGEILETATKRPEVVLERQGADGKIYLFRIPPAGEDKGERR